MSGMTALTVGPVRQAGRAGLEVFRSNAPPMTTSYDTIILGAAAAGLMCAAVAAQRGRRVLVLDHAKKPGEKILIPGGGRCNFTNRHVTPANFLSQNPRFCISALKRYTQDDFIALVERHGIAYHERDHGQLFCDHSAKDIVAMLLDEAGDAEVRCATTINAVTRTDGPEARFEVETIGGTFDAPAVVVATGGPAIPQMGASGFAYDLAKQFGLNVIEPRAGLVPLTFNDQTMEAIGGLSGVSVDATASHKKTRFNEAPALSIGRSVIGVFLITAVPVALGIAIKRYASDFADAFERRARVVATVLFVVIISGAIYSERENVLSYLAQAGLVALSLNVVMILIAVGLARASQLDIRQGRAIALECGLQNGTLAIFVALTLLGNREMMIPGAIYSLIMFPTALAYLFLVRRRVG